MKNVDLHDEVRRLLALALLERLHAEGLIPVTSKGRFPYQQKIGQRLGWNQQTVSRLQNGELEKLSVERLLNAWQRVGGRATLRLESPPKARNITLSELDTDVHLLAK